MDWGGPEFILAIIAISTVGWLISSWIRARHGYPLENEWSGMSHRRDPDGEQATRAIVAENEQLKATVSRLEERLKVLERIATDPAKRLADDIDSLR